MPGWQNYTDPIQICKDPDPHIKKYGSGSLKLGFVQIRMQMHPENWIYGSALFFN